ncbi:MAG: 50S ribosomal protein L18 [Cytophagaceae bacterium]|nr:50S ribosomal protein L18 [Cytophagaceae bacterium]
MKHNRKEERRTRIKRSIRTRLTGTEDRPRLSVFRSNSGIYAQIINDLKGITLVSASSKEMDGDVANTVGIAKTVGQKLAEKAIAQGVSAVVFDRNGYLYHGKVKALAEGAREGGLKF